MLVSKIPKQWNFVGKDEAVSLSIMFKGLALFIYYNTVSILLSYFDLDEIKTKTDVICN